MQWGFASAHVYAVLASFGSAAAQALYADDGFPSCCQV